MRPIINYIGAFFQETDKRVLMLVSLLTALLIYLNYSRDVDQWISNHNSFLFSFSARYIIYLIAFGVPYLLYSLIKGQKYFKDPIFNLFLFISPAIFSLKVALNIPFHFLEDAVMNDYWNHVVYWPVLLFIIMLMLYVLWRFFDDDQPFYGTSTWQINWKPYWLMLLIMVPLIIAASTQADFLAMYPKLKLITGHSADVKWWQKLLFEISYGSDFIGIELFFRGFLILGFIKWAGKNAILPMACFYCTIHFGKPLGECISSYFGGMLLGIVVSNTQSLWGGLIVHLGIAWMMEFGGFIGNSLSH